MVMGSLAFELMRPFAGVEGRARSTALQHLCFFVVAGLSDTRKTSFKKKMFLKNSSSWYQKDQQQQKKEGHGAQLGSRKSERYQDRWK